MDTCVSAVEHVRRMRGGAQSHLLRASDGAHYVTKFMNNPQHVRVLANEMLATHLGLRLGLPMARVDVIDVSDRLIEDSDDLRVELGGASIPCSSGRQLASLYAGDVNEASVCEYLPDDEIVHVVNIQDFARVLVLDKWTCNSDGRQVIFKHEASRSGKYRAVFIDQGFCFNAGEWNFPDAPLRGAYARQCVYQHVTAWESFEPALTRAERLDLGDLWRYGAQVPEEWYEYDLSGMKRLIETLYRRRLRIRDLITEFRKSSRNPFPNWTER
jgi:hypothetical protein